MLRWKDANVIRIECSRLICLTQITTRISFPTRIHSQQWFTKGEFRIPPQLFKCLTTPLMNVTIRIKISMVKQQRLPLLMSNVRDTEMVQTAELEWVVITPALGDSFKYDSPRISGYNSTISTTNGTSPTLVSCRIRSDWLPSHYPQLIGDWTSTILRKKRYKRAESLSPLQYFWNIQANLHKLTPSSYHLHPKPQYQKYTTTRNPKLTTPLKQWHTQQVSDSRRAPPGKPWTSSNVPIYPPPNGSSASLVLPTLPAITGQSSPTFLISPEQWLRIWGAILPALRVTTTPPHSGGRLGSLYRSTMTALRGIRTYYCTIIGTKVPLIEALSRGWIKTSTPSRRSRSWEMTIVRRFQRWCRGKRLPDTSGAGLDTFFGGRVRKCMAGGDW